MPKNRFNFNVIFKKVEELQKKMNYPTGTEEIDKYNEMKELSDIVLEIQEPEIRHLTST